MTDILALSEKLRRRIEWQSVPDDLYDADLTLFIVDAIIDLYVKTGRYNQLDEENDFVKTDEEGYVSLNWDLPLDERQYVLVSAAIAFYEKAQSDVTTLTSYSTDAMTVTHGDKPFANLEEKLNDLRNELLRIWYKMPRYHML